MTDFNDRASGLDSPPAELLDIIPDDAQDLPKPVRGLMVRTGGDVALITLSGAPGLMPSLAPGVQYAIRARAVRATGTTATGLVGLV